MASKRLFPLLCLLLLFAGCKHEGVCDVPFGDATAQLDPNDPLYPGLNTVGGYEYLHGGHQGIVVVRTGINDFVAFECTCPYDQGLIEVSSDYAGSVLQCKECGSCFLAESYGAPLEGSKTPCSLYQYATYYDGWTLYISNY